MAGLFLKQTKGDFFYGEQNLDPILTGAKAPISLGFIRL